MKLYDLLDNAKCYEHIRELRWPDGVICPRCNSDEITRQGKNESQPERQRYFCKNCRRKFDDLTLSVFSGHHQPLKIWVSCLHLMSLNISNSLIAQELDLNISNVQKMTRQFREAVCSKQGDVVLSDEVECDEVYIVAGHKGQPKAVKQKGRKGRRNRLKGARGRGTLEKEKPPVFGMIQRNGQVVIRMLPNVKQATIKPLSSQSSQQP